ncbi:MAG: tRNA methyltransferase [Candidatus Daviesbacteria bacterium GW2011_GWA2_38_24]|uniref:tRNA methyltransferase n=1 Tax=Candidatus Daviesbacteria bacterium GW2011_GWA2_38_24 TaxID=1618422 RepID=A0A0G0ML61_9BACT|nr:MAG: tRNA methyltransferase [Candidatus Daviesbacteria bacterium GW2011_GWA2_38_24]KKQ80682.1 MAG: tRNA methyltransferase [Candidatus Daviesbacteria bacterium GW2011_GWA1_38_7]OGE24312.1 MAG: hypothetical protein A2688_00010 [Candidatus Daviesbacteria bacterium RIFCSPHIGHO2_01_FULL_38_8]
MKRFADLTRQERIRKAMSLRRKDLVLVLENLSEDQNIAAILRSAEAFGVGKVYIVHPEGKKPAIARQSATGAHKWVNIEFYNSIIGCLKNLKKDGFYIIGALVDPDANILWDEDFSGKVAIVVGSESQGMSEEAQRLVAKNIYLPMLGLTESLNVSVAAGIFLYEAIRQKEKGQL